LVNLPPLSVFYNERMDALFGTAKYFLSCETTNSSTSLLNAILRSLHLPRGQPDPLQQLKHYLTTSNELKLLVLDNFETPWMGDTQEQVRQILSILNSASTLTLLLTMRGDFLPLGVKWSKPILPPLSTFTLEAARATFIDIAGEPDEHASPELDRLLDLVDRVPLAVSIMANVAQSGDSIPDLLRTWERERTGVLSRGGSDQ